MKSQEGKESKFSDVKTTATTATTPDEGIYVVIMHEGNDEYLPTFPPKLFDVRSPRRYEASE